LHDASAHAGKVSQQPRLGDGRRLDDVAGYNALLPVAPGFIEVSNVTAENLCVVLADSEASQDYLSSLGAKAVLIRPDRYVYGAVSRLDELEAMLAGFRDMPLQARGRFITQA
jgi:3-(3-hydroxy-phenyl)propionate hydroxylase